MAYNTRIDDIRRGSLPFDDQINRTLARIDHLRACVTARLAELDAAIAEARALTDAGCCTGVEYWRDGTRLYVNHGTDEACPVHGTPGPGKRLRCYVGSDETKIAQAQAAMARAARYLTLITHIDRVERTLISVGTRLAQLYHDLGFTMDNSSPSADGAPSADGEPQADPHWQPFPW